MSQLTLKLLYERKDLFLRPTSRFSSMFPSQVHLVNHVCDKASREPASRSVKAKNVAVHEVTETSPRQQQQQQQQQRQSLSQLLIAEHLNT